MRCESCGYEHVEGTYCPQCGAASGKRATASSYAAINEAARFSGQDGYGESVTKGGQVTAERRANPL